MPAVLERYNKATAAVVGAAVSTLIFVVTGAEVSGEVQGVLTGLGALLAVVFGPANA